jgi:flagellar basal-body rod protein FlgG
MRALYTAASGMEAQQRRIDVTANNVANASTTGFKAGRAEFQELLYQQVRAAERAEEGGRPVGVEIGLGVVHSASVRDLAQGALLATENPLDLAIEGNGFFRVRMPDGGEAYTRAGNFRINALGRLVTQDGYEVDPGIVVPEEVVSLSVRRDGAILVTLPGDTNDVEIGRLELTVFTNPSGLRSLGRGLHSETEASGRPQDGRPGERGLGEIAQGFLENSNVQVVNEMIAMIAAQRTYEVNSKVIQTADEMLRAATNLK